MKSIIVLALCFCAITTNAQEVKKEIDWHNWEAPYQLNKPDGWGFERFPVPISFAPQITYKGVEDIRFTPGWAKATTDEYWTYAFLWYLDDYVITDEKIIAANLKDYYTGLIDVNSDSVKKAGAKLVPVVTSFKKVTTEKTDKSTFSGTVTMYDYMQHKSITLNCIVHLKYCSDDKKTILFYEISPQPFDHKNWTTLNKLWLDFRCKK